MCTPRLMQVMQVCLAANPCLVVKRARFSALVQADILRALNGVPFPRGLPSWVLHQPHALDMATRLGSSICHAEGSSLPQRNIERPSRLDSALRAGLAAPDEAAARAVDARQEIDLRIGAAFTRFQTLLLQVDMSPNGSACSAQAAVSQSFRT